jgi:hypothetical protein
LEISKGRRVSLQEIEERFAMEKKTDQSFLHPPRRASCFDIQMGACYFSGKGGHPKMIEIQDFSRKEKIRLMEAIWADLSKEEEELESPEWHREALRETEERLASGEEKLINWETAKALLLNRSQVEPAISSP